MVDIVNLLIWGEKAIQKNGDSHSLQGIHLLILDIFKSCDLIGNKDSRLIISFFEVKKLYMKMESPIVCKEFIS